MNKDKPDVLNIAHRGFSSAYPENTLLAFDKAMQAGAHGVECDIRITKDGQLIVFHDLKTRALCSKNLNVEKTNWNELKELKVLHQEPICRPEEMLSHFPDAFINFEIKKSERELEIVEKLYKLILQSGKKDSLMLSSFSTAVIQHAHSKQPKTLDVGISPIFNRPRDKTFKEFSDTEWVYSWNVHFTAIRSFSKKLKRKQIDYWKPFWFWTMNTHDEWQWAFESGLQFNAIITDHPDHLNEFLETER